MMAKMRRAIPGASFFRVARNVRSARRAIAIVQRRSATSATFNPRGQEDQVGSAKEAISGDTETTKWVNKPYRAP